MSSNIDEVEVPALFTDTHQEALDMELFVVDAFLRRNRCSHQRTKYYQRLSMAFRFICRRTNDTVALIDLWSEASSFNEEMAILVQNERKKRKRQEIFFEISSPQSQKNEDAMTRKRLQEHAQKVSLSIFESLPEALNRLDHAANAFFTEIARGFFLPLCTVGAAVIARMRSLLLQLGLHLIRTTLPSIEKSWNALNSVIKSARPSFSAENQLWSRQILFATLEYLHEQSTAKAITPPEELPRDERTSGLLYDLGLSKRISLRSPEETKQEQPLDEEKPLPSAGTTTSGNHDDDFGETVARITTMSVDKVSSVLERSIGQPLASADSRTAEHTHELDHNLQIAKELQAQKKEKGRRKHSTDKPKKPKKKKQKKETKGDFFDDLFGK